MRDVVIAGRAADAMNVSRSYFGNIDLVQQIEAVKKTITA